MNEKKSKAKKLIVLLLAAVLLVGCSIGGTLAYLKASTKPVVNTFAATGITLTLTETDATEGDDGYEKEFKLIPGKTYAKDPKVTITGTTGVEYYVYVKVEKAGLDCLEYEINTTDWTQLKDASNNDVAGVFYKEIAADADETADEYTVNCFVLKGNTDYADGCITISKNLTADQMKNATETTTLKFTAYAIQQEGFENAADAWAEAAGLSNNG